MRFKIFRVLLLVMTIFVGVGAFVGGICMLIKPDEYPSALFSGFALCRHFV